MGIEGERFIRSGTRTSVFPCPAVGKESPPTILIDVIVIGKQTNNMDRRDCPSQIEIMERPGDSRKVDAQQA